MTTEELFTPSFIISCISLLVSSIVLVITILNYRRHRRFDNENHIFKIKIEDYKFLLNEITEAFKLFPTKAELPELINDPLKSAEIADKMDEALIKLSFLIVPYSIVLHPEVLKKIEELTVFMIDGDVESQDIEYINKQLDKAYSMANEIIAMIRKDLYSDDLNKRLNKRLN